MGKTSNQKQAEQNNLQIQRQQVQLQQQQIQLSAQAAQRQASIYSQVQPFASGALGIGNQAMAGKAPAALTAAPLTSLAQSTNQNRQNLIDFFGQSGQGAGGLNSGILAGPIANTYSDQATAAAGIQQNAVLQGLGLGFQGANVLQGQQAIFSPTGFAGAASQAGGVGTQDPTQYQSAGMSLAGSAIGAIGTAAGGALSKSCWVAASFYGWNSYETNTIRHWMMSDAPLWFRNMYIKYGEGIAKTPLRWLFKPIFEYVLSK